MSHGPPVHHENGLYCGPAVGSGDVGILLVPRESVLSLTRELPVPRTVAPSTPSRIAVEEALLGRAGGGAPGLSPHRLRSAPRALSHLRLLRRCRGGGADPRIGRGGHPPAGHVGARQPALRQWRVVRGPWGAGLLGARPSQPVARPPQDPVPGPAGPRGGPAHRLARGGGRQPRHPAPTPALHPLAAGGDRAGRAHQSARSRAPVGPPRRSPSTSVAAGLPPQAISPARFFPKLAAASHCYALFEVWFLDAQRANRGRRLRPPPLQQPRFAHVALGAVVVETRTGRRRKRGFCAARKHWKSLPHVRGGN
jgi:hypothetical protein